MNNPKDSGQQGFGSLLYYTFFLKKKFRVDETAEKMGIRPDTLYRYIRSENIMPPDRVIDLVKATGEIEFLEFFCDPCGFIPVKRPTGQMLDGSPEKDEITLAINLGHALAEIEKAYSDGKVDKAEHRAIHRSLTRLQQKAAELGEKIRAEVK